MKPKGKLVNEKPFAKLLKCYLLLQIDALNDDSLRVLTALESKLQKTYNRFGSWDEIVAAEMDFPPTFPKQVQQLWAHNQQIAKNSGSSLAPDQFVDMLIRDNFTYALN